MSIFSPASAPGILICLSLLLLISGAILLYTIRRFTVLENAIVEQGRVLQSYIGLNQVCDSQNSLASQQAVQSAIHQIELESNEKIDVSDIDNDNVDETSEEETSDADSSDEGSSDEDNELKIVPSDDKINVTANIMSIENLMSDNLELISNGEERSDIKMIDMNDEKTDDLESKDTNKELNVKELVKSELQKTTAISKMRVADLRTLVIQRKLLTDDEELNKIKRDNLIKLLQENSN